MIYDIIPGMEEQNMFRITSTKAILTGETNIAANTLIHFREP